MHLPLLITTDLVCPWCRTGLASLRTALKIYTASHPNTTSSLHFLPFQLDPSLPSPGLPKSAYLAHRLGSPATAAAAEARVKAVAKQAGLDVAETSEGATVGNTLRAHRLVWFAGGEYLGRFKAKGVEGSGTEAREALQGKVVDGLHRAYFVENKDISLVETLVDVAQEVGMEERGVREFLESDEGREEVERLMDEAVEKGVRGVPFVEVKGRGVQGGIGVEGWLGAFEKLAQMEREEGK
ncbi:hypothetical protein KVT40_003608 [Elsinoe batatas]|uniref:DSBA-like thioredoxin domain-containing protein n=1 Tax=Elsinoe batatas TaxID=2601811 RepID=A0A8K0PD70_9PEZI|nr:hypothetical protein KVT40_003608 [Elsinoe batatas]